MQQFISGYIEQQKAALTSIRVEQVVELIRLFRKALEEEKQIFVFGNGGSAANATHFVTDLGKGASDKTQKRFRCCSLNDNSAWITALGNDYSYEDIFVRQLMNVAKSGDLVLTMSVSGNSSNLIKALEWCKQNQVYSIALLGGKKGKLFDLADQAVVINETHYGRVEDAHMGICHMIAFAFMELPQLQG